MQSIPLMPLLPNPLWLRLVAPDRVLSVGQIELNSNNAKLIYLKSVVFPFNRVYTKKNYTYAKMHCLKQLF